VRKVCKLASEGDLEKEKELLDDEKKTSNAVA
jgi:hypothetical protein